MAAWVFEGWGTIVAYLCVLAIQQRLSKRHRPEVGHSQCFFLLGF